MPAAYVQKYRCPDCAQSFRWPARQPPPDFCPACGSWVGESPDDAPFTPKAPLVVTRQHSLDKVYRAMEEGSVHRAQLAAEHLGVSEADVSAMKITDMKDRPHEGENSFVTHPNPVSNLMNNARAGTVGMVGSAGIGFATNAHTGRTPDGVPIRGDVPHAGAAAARNVGHWHSRMVQAVRREGQLGKG